MILQRYCPRCKRWRRCVIIDVHAERNRNVLLASLGVFVVTVRLLEPGTNEVKDHAILDITIDARCGDM